MQGTRRKIRRFFLESLAPPILRAYVQIRFFSLICQGNRPQVASTKLLQENERHRGMIDFLMRIAQHIYPITKGKRKGG